ncbi:hypothetical protein quinque_002450 [Culex quinquefasciatus]
MGGIAAVSAAFFTKGTHNPGNDHHQFYRLQDTVIEKDPEWMVAVRGLEAEVVSQHSLPPAAEPASSTQSILQNVLWR